MAAVGAQLALQPELLAVEARLAAAGHDQAHVGAAEHAEALRLPLQRGAAFGDAQRQRAAHAEAAFAAGDRRLDDPQAVAFQLGAQPAAGERDAPRRRFDAERVARQRAAEQRLAQRAAALEAGADAPGDPHLGEQRLGEQAQLLQLDLCGAGGRRVGREAGRLAFGAQRGQARRDVERGGDAVVGEARVERGARQPERHLRRTGQRQVAGGAAQREAAVQLRRRQDRPVAVEREVAGQALLAEEVEDRLRRQRGERADRGQAAVLPAQRLERDAAADQRGVETRRARRGRAPISRLAGACSTTARSPAFSNDTISPRQAPPLQPPFSLRRQVELAVARLEIALVRRRACRRR